jgi:hypothetical protein
MKGHALALFLGLGAFSFSALAEITPADTRLAGLASSMLQNVDEARKAIARRDQQAATGNLDLALMLASQIRNEAPAGTEPLVVTIRTESETESVTVPARRGKPRKDSTVSKVAGRHSREAIDIGSAVERMNAAKSALAGGNFADADANLDTVQKSVFHETVTGDMPLARVRENLALARSRVEEGKFKHAGPPLNAAARALANYTGPNAAEAARMRAEIAAYARDIKDDNANALDRIDAWFREVSRWLAATPGR